MFYISLPFFYENYEFNQFFKDYVLKCNETKDSKLVAKFNIEYVYGSFPWSLWNGNINNHKGKAVLADTIRDRVTNSMSPVRLDASNVYLIEQDYFDIHENAILTCINGTNTSYEVSSVKLMEYISKINMNNKFIISNNAQLFAPFNREIIDLFTQQDCIDLVNIGYHNFLELTQLNKIEISIGHCQRCSEEKLLSCIDSEQNNIYHYSNQSNFINCPFAYKPNNYYEEIKPYLQQGFKHFKIIANNQNLKEFNINLIKSFVKPEYVGECLNEYYRKHQQ